MNTMTKNKNGSRVRFITFGCKVNQYETQAMRELLEKSMVCESETREEECDFVVINTCTVTNKADKGNKYWIRRARREYPKAKIVVTGCYVERNRKEIEDIGGVDFVLSNSEKGLIADKLVKNGAGEKKEAYSCSLSKLNISSYEGRSRAYIKIQDGCNHSCSYCKVVLVRGPLWSRPLSEIKEELIRLRDSGYKEIILTGIQVGAYGLDFEKKTEHCNLSDVLNLCHETNGIERVRISSIEPMDIGEELLDVFSSSPKLCPHFHIPLQSGDDEILKRMNRKYTGESYKRLIDELKRKIPDFTLTLDVIVGFPGETEEQFENTIKLLESVNPMKCHIFPYSMRPGTRASEWKNLADNIIKRRTKTLRDLSGVWGNKIKKEYVGKCAEVLVERKTKKDEFYEGLTRNYIRVFFNSLENVTGQIIAIRITDLKEGRLLGEMLEKS